MTEDLVGVRTVIYSDKAYRLTIPEQIPLLWNKAGNDRIPICFFRLNGKVAIEPLEDVLKNPNYPDGVIKSIRDEWLEFVWKRDMYKRRLLQKEYIKGNLSERDYRLFLDRHFEQYQRITQELRKTLLARGLTFMQIERVQDVVELELLFLEGEKDERISELLTEIKALVDEKRHLEELLVTVEARRADGSIPDDIGKLTRQDLTRELMLATKRIERIKKYVGET